MDRLSSAMAAGRLTNLLDIIAVRTGSVGDAIWWGPVVGADEPSPAIGADDTDKSITAGRPDMVSDDKRVPMTVCEEAP